MSEPEQRVSPMEELCQHLAGLTEAVKNLQHGYTQLEERVLVLSNPTGAQGSSHASTSSAGTGSTPTVVMLPPEPRVPTPEKFSGNRSSFRAFRNSCELYFALQPRTFSLEVTKVGFVISLLTGEPQTWAHRLLERKDESVTNLTTFFDAMAQLYEDPQLSATAEAALRTLQQGRRAAEDYVAEFRRWSADTDWNDAALRYQFRMGLSDPLKDELARVGVPQTLNALIDLAIQIDRRLRERRAERATGFSRPTWMLPKAPSHLHPVPIASPAPTADTPEPMQLGVLRPSLTPEERQRRRVNNLCLYCGGPSHYVRNCPLKLRKCLSMSPSHTDFITQPASHLALSVSFQLPGKTLLTPAIIDSGACSCFMDSSFAAKHQIPLLPKTHGLSVHLADGSAIKSGPVVLETAPILAVISSSHHELLRMDIISSPIFPVILGMPWLQVHNPAINWATGEVTFSSPYCQQFCGPQDPHGPSTLLCLESEAEIRQSIPEAYHDFLDVFSKQRAEALPPHRAYDCPIELLPGAEIPFGRIFPLTEVEQGALKEYIDENLKKGFIRPSTSPAGAGIFFVEKKDHTLRPCVDYRELNKITVKNRYPLPLVPELFQRLGAATVFTKLDLRGAYNLVRIRDGDEWKTAFRSRFGHFEYLVMPFGLCNAPATFQYFINDVLRDFLDLFVIVYLDDILIFSSSLEFHRRHVRSVLGRLRQHGLYAKAEKCEFEQESIPFLGLIISSEGIKMDPQKISAILDWPVPADKKGIQRFVGFANFYRKFIKGFSAIIAPITQLTKQGTRFHWSPEAQGAFEALKELFTSAPVLGHPDSSLPFVLEVDASEIAVGAILSQRQGTKAQLHPVAFFSRKLSTAEKNYDVGDRELLAIKSALEEWRYLLEGAAHPILIFTDHKNLEYLRSAKRLRPRQARWALFFSRFSFHVTYRPGSKNTKPDALSRMFHKSKEIATPDTILAPGNFLLLQENLLSRIKQASTGQTPPSEPGLQFKDGVFWHEDKIYTPESLRVSVLELCHDHALAGHFGLTKTTDLVQRTFWWPQLRVDCKKYVESCTTCIRNKTHRTKAWGLLKPLSVPDRPWRMLSIDFIVELPPAEDHTTIFVVVDRLSKMAHFIPMKGTPSASETAQAFIKEIIRLHGVPANIVSDRGVQFTSRFWRSLCKALDIELSFSSAYHPQTNGLTERTNQTLEQYLRCFSSFAQDDWISLLPLAEFAYNNSIHSATKQTPFFANFGFHPSFLPNSLPECTVPAVQEKINFFSTNNQLLQETMTKTQEHNKTTFDRKRRGELILSPGDLVWLSTTNLRMACPSKKLGPKFLGPFPVRRRINEVAYELELPDSLRVHPVFHVSLLKPSIPNPFPNRSTSPPDPVIVDGEEEFEVEAILDYRRRRNQNQFLIKWKGYGPEENSWEPERNIHAKSLVRSFKRSHPEKFARMGIRRLPLGGGQCHEDPARNRRLRFCGSRSRLRSRMRVHARVHTPIGARRGI